MSKQNGQSALAKNSNQEEKSQCQACLEKDEQIKKLSARLDHSMDLLEKCNQLFDDIKASSCKIPE